MGCFRLLLLNTDRFRRSVSRSFRGIVTDERTDKAFVQRCEEELQGPALVFPLYNSVLLQCKTVCAGSQRLGRLTVRPFRSVVTNWPKCLLSVPSIPLSGTTGALVSKIQAWISRLDISGPVTILIRKTVGNADRFLRGCESPTTNECFRKIHAYGL